MNENDIVYVSSAFDFLKTIHHEYYDHINCGMKNHLQFYRGQMNSEWGVSPSIERKGFCSLSSFEREIVQEFISKRPNEFNHIQNSFGITAKMQHYGLTTRLIDMTSNPAVALYFACCNCFDVDGEVFFYNTTREDVLTPNVTDLVMKFYLNEKKTFGKFDLLDYYKKCKNFYNEEELNQGFYFMISNEPRVAMTEWISERMIRQSSTFLITPYKSVIANFELNKINGIGLYEYLHDLGYETVMSEAIVVPFIDDMKDYFLRYHQDNKRFIVKAEYKKEILRELKTIGIYKSFLFPELEYEGSRIIDEYMYLTQQTKNQ